MKMSAAPRFITRLFTDLTVIIAVCVIFAAGATKARVAAESADDAPTLYAATPD